MEQASGPRRGLPKWALYLLIAAGVVMVLGLLGGIAAFWVTGGAVTAADLFFRDNANRGPAAAWAETAPAFQATTPLALWQQTSATQGLARYSESSWSSRSVNGAIAELTGVLKLTGGAAVPVTVALVKGAGNWQVQSVHFAEAGAASGLAGAPKMIPGEVLVQACRGILAQNAHISLDSADCSQIVPTKGAHAECSVTRLGKTGRMQVTIDAIDAAGHADLDCKVDIPR